MRERICDNCKYFIKHCTSKNSQETCDNFEDEWEDEQEELFSDICRIMDETIILRSNRLFWIGVYK